MTSEEDELVAHLVDSWVETYKKSAVTVLLLDIIGDEAVTAADVATRIESRTGWQLTERGLYRSLRRLASIGAVDVTEVDAPRTGAKRKVFEISRLGRRFHRKLVDELVDLR